MDVLSNKVARYVNAPFAARDAIVIEPPPASGPGHWAGAPGAFSDGASVYLAYRVRWPRPRRGGELRIARGDGERFETIWSAEREDFSSPSIERCAILRDGRTWRLYVSYVDGLDDAGGSTSSRRAVQVRSSPPRADSRSTGTSRTPSR